MSLTHVKSAIRIRIFTFYRFKAEQYTSSRVQNVGCVYYCCSSYYTAARYSWKSRLAVVDFDWRHLVAKPSTRTSIRCKDLGDICCTRRGLAHFVLNCVVMATRVGRGKIQLAAFDGLFPKTPPQMQKISQISLTQPSYSQFCPKFRFHGNEGRSGKNAIGSIRWPIPENPPIGAKISYVSRVMANFVPNFVAMATGVNQG